MLLAGCVSNGPWQPDREPEPVAGADGSDLMIVEIDEAGPLFVESGQRERMLDWLNRDQDPIVVFINGWHHNAEPGDENLDSFERFLAGIEERTGRPLRGLYIGWRGDSIDILKLPEPVDFPTIWGRRRASVAVGENGLLQILTDLEALPGRRAFIIGHSLGGSALFHAMRSRFQSTVNDNVQDVMLNPPVAAEEFAEMEDRMTAAFAAMPQARGVAEGMSTEELMRQNRKLVVFQALGDRAVGKLYRIAFLFKVPIGFHEDSISHTAFLCGEGETCVDDGICQRLLGDSFVIRARETPENDCPSQFARPVWVVSGEDSVSSGHNDILNGPQQDAIAALLVGHMRM